MMLPYFTANSKFQIFHVRPTWSNNTTSIPYLLPVNSKSCCTLSSFVNLAFTGCQHREFPSSAFWKLIIARTSIHTLGLRADAKSPTVSRWGSWPNDVLLQLSWEGQCGGRAGPKVLSPKFSPYLVHLRSRDTKAASPIPTTTYKPNAGELVVSGIQRICI